MPDNPKPRKVAGCEGCAGPSPCPWHSAPASSTPPHQICGGDEESHRLAVQKCSITHGFSPRAEAAAPPTPQLDECQGTVVAWGTECFGAEHMADHKVRALRLLEESIEFAQSVDAPVEQCVKLVEYVYSRPAGDPSQELGGVGVGWVAAATALGVSALETLRTEINRVLSKPRTHFTQRNQNKLNAGFDGGARRDAPAQPQYENRYTMVFAMTEDFKDIMLLRKSSELYRGQWNAPGGKVEPNETELECAVREMREETQLAISADNLRYVMRFSCECDQKEGLHEVIVYGVFLPLVDMKAARGTVWEPVAVWSGGDWNSEKQTVWYVPSLLQMVFGRMKQKRAAQPEPRKEQK
jgi:ADP-ribose pyrophosphatase YjhB (NUDIX family)